MDIVDLYTKFMSQAREELPSLDYFAGVKDFANFIKARDAATIAALTAERDALRAAVEKIAGGEWCDNDGRGCNNENTARLALERLRLDAAAQPAQEQRTVDHAADCAINVGMLGECDCGAE